jgi:hypothetical protein
VAYIFSRSTASTQPDYAAIQESGATVALNAEDPHLAEQIQRARENGMNPAIWIPAHTGQDPIEYARKMASLVQHYGPSAILPNVETQGEGASGSAWSHQMMAEFSRYVPQGTIDLSVVVEPNKTGDVYDYSAYTQYGGGAVAEAFSGDMKSKWDPQHIHDVLAAAGVPEDKINVLLAPGQEPGSVGNYSAYTWDDMNPEQQRTFLQNYATRNTTAGPVQTVGGEPRKTYGYNPNMIPTDNAPGAPGPSYNEVPGTRGPDFQKLVDKNNPAAVNYANAQLKRLAAMGYTPQQFGLQSLDPTAQWRALSAIVGATQAARTGHADEYVTPAGTPPEVAAVVSSILGTAVRPSAPTPDVSRTGYPQDDATSIAMRHAAAARVTAALASRAAPATPAGVMSRVAASAPPQAAARVATIAANVPPSMAAPAQERLSQISQAAAQLLAAKTAAAKPSLAQALSGIQGRRIE